MRNAKLLCYEAIKPASRELIVEASSDALRVALATIPPRSAIWRGAMFEWLMVTLFVPVAVMYARHFWTVAITGSAVELVRECFLVLLMIVAAWQLPLHALHRSQVVVELRVAR